MSFLTILGAGSWGTALAIHIARNGHPVRLWGREEQIKEIQASRCNNRYLPGIKLNEPIELFADLQAAIQDVNDILIAVPSVAFRDLIHSLYLLKPANIRIAWATKGLDPTTNQLLHQVVFEIYQHILPIAILSGPSFAQEVAMGLPTAITLTSNSIDFEKDITHKLHGFHFRVYSQPDLIGVQICGAVKNCLAIAAGISDGLGYGANARAALITRGLAEMTRLGMALGGKQETFMGLSGVGDLVLTCTDNLSRNRRFGYALGLGSDMQTAEHSIGQVVEGKANVFMVLALARQHHVEMPIIEQITQVIAGKLTPQASVEKLFAREQKSEKLW